MKDYKDKMTILVLDPDNYYNNKILNVYIEPWNRNYKPRMSFEKPSDRTDELVWKIEDSGDDWFWQDELVEGQTYIEVTERVKRLLVFL